MCNKESWLYEKTHTIGVLFNALLKHKKLSFTYYTVLAERDQEIVTKHERVH